VVAFDLKLVFVGLKDGNDVSMSIRIRESIAFPDLGI